MRFTLSSTQQALVDEVDAVVDAAPARLTGRELLRLLLARGVADEDVEPAERLGRVVDEGRDRRGVADIDGLPEHRAGLRQFVGDGLELGFATGADAHGRPLGKEGLGDGEADALARAAD